MSLEERKDTSASRLIRSKEEILKQWLQQTRSDVPAARHQSSPVLRDEIPTFLDEIADALDSHSSVASACEADPSICREHGKQRARHSQYSLKEVIQEYILLKESILDVLEKRGGISKTDQACITKSIETGILEASAEYVKEQDQVRQQFIAILSHDLRNPLTAVRMSAQVILRQPDNTELVERFSLRIIENVKRIDDMVRDLLDSSRVRAGEKIMVQKAPCDLVLLTKEVVTEFATVHGDRFVLKAPEQLKGVWSRDGLRRIIENLLSNAVKYGKPDSEITTTLEPSEHGVNLSVHNSGEPISAADLPNLFMPYNRTVDAQQGKMSGWGLGLTLVKGMTEAHGGTVSVSSSRSDGTTFKVFIPA